MKLSVLTGLCGLALALGAARGSASEAGWRTLPLITKGKIDPAWVQVGWGGFVIDDGALRTAPAPEGLGVLVYKKGRLGDCQLRVVFKAEAVKSNAGVYVRLADGILDRIGKPGAAFDRSGGKISKASMTAVQASNEREEGSWYAVHHGYEVQIMDSGDALHRTGSIYSMAPSTAKTKPGEWRTMIITLRGDTISVDVDGEHATDFDPKSPTIPPRTKWPAPKREPVRPRAGYIGLQNHDPGDIVWFKEVSVRPLAP